MSRRTIPNQRKSYKDLNKRLNGYTRKILAIYSVLAYEGALYALENGYNGDVEFHFSNYPKTKKKANSLFQNFRDNMQALIYSGISAEWKHSNTFQDLLANKILKSFTRTIDGRIRKRYFDTNNAALEAFKKRRKNGLTISQRIWNQTPSVRANLERAISIGISKGISAVALSKRIVRYLNDYNALSKDYRKKYNKTIDISACEYRSARLARNEINLAYRTAEQERWKKMDFIKGKHIRPTKNGSHKTDMCDDLAGDYPKMFEWKGWHINCMCYAVPIVMSEKEFYGKEEVEPITSVPEGFKKWLSNTERKVESGAKIPTFLEDNENYNRYLTYKADAKYKDVRLNENLGVEATHVNHGHDKPQEKYRFFDGLFDSDYLEKEMQRLACNAGHSAILREEGRQISKGITAAAFDLELDGRIMDIASVTTLRDYYDWQIYNKNKQVFRYLKQGGKEPTNTVCVFFHDSSYYADYKIRKGYKIAIKRCEERNEKVYIKNVVCAIKTESGLQLKEFNF